MLDITKILQAKVECSFNVRLSNAEKLCLNTFAKHRSISLQTFVNVLTFYERCAIIRM